MVNVTGSTTQISINTNPPSKVSASGATSPIIKSDTNSVQSNAITISPNNQIESPFIEIQKTTQDVVNVNAESQVDSAQISQNTQVSNQIRNLSSQQSDISQRQSDLEKQSVEINREIQALRQKEQQIVREKFKLQQSSVGAFVNLTV